MKKIILIITCFVALGTLASAQNVDLFSGKFATGIDIFNDLVMDAPKGDVEFRGFNPGVNVYAMRTFPIGKTNFAFAGGLGLGMHNIYSNSTLQVDSAGVSFLREIPEKAANGKNIDYKKSKISLTYVDLPVELRFKTEGGFRISAGFKVGYLINAHTKYKGDDLIDGSKTKIKVGRLPNIQSWRYGPSFQIGYKWVNLMAFYSISTVFEDKQGPAIYPISLGLTLRPF